MRSTNRWCVCICFTKVIHFFFCHIQSNRAYNYTMTWGWMLQFTFSNQLFSPEETKHVYPLIIRLNLELSSTSNIKSDWFLLENVCKYFLVVVKYFLRRGKITDILSSHVHVSFFPVVHFILSFCLCTNKKSSQNKPPNHLKFQTMNCSSIFIILLKIKVDRGGLMIWHLAKKKKAHTQRFVQLYNATFFKGKKCRCIIFNQNNYKITFHFKVLFHLIPIVF